MQNNHHTVARRLKKLRKDKGWSLTACAEHTGVSKAMLGQIERQESSPTLATLWKLATGFNVSLSWLLNDEQQPMTFDFAHERIQVERLLAFDPQTQQEVYKLCMAEGAQSHSDAHRRGTFEMMYVQSGVLDVVVGETQVTIKAGEAYRFDAAQPHSYIKRYSGKTEFLAVINYV